VTERPVFVSYSQGDRAAALGIVAHLEAQGLRCWVAPRDVTPAADWAAEIVEAIAAARVMVLVFSASANASPQVRREVERAVHRELTVLPFRVEDVLPARSLEYFLSSQHWLDAFPGPLEPHFARLAVYLQRLLSAASSGDAPLNAAPPARAALDAVALTRLEGQLAQHIGPLAKLLITRAAPRAASLEALIQELSREIDSEGERQRFVAACRQSLRGR
jgi:TIR domain